MEEKPEKWLSKIELIINEKNKAVNLFSSLINSLYPNIRLINYQFFKKP